MEYAIEMNGVSKKFRNADAYAVDHVDLRIREGEFITILGSSGCGKTTLLKMINRLYEPDEGEIRLFGENIKDVDVIRLRRRIGYVIQQVGLFPHMTVAENVATVPKLLKWDKKAIRTRTEELLTLGVGWRPPNMQNAIPYNFRRSATARRRSACACRRSENHAARRAFRRDR